MKIRYATGAENDLLHLRRYIVDRFGAETWSRSLAELRERIAMLADQPQLGTVPPELEEVGIGRYREITVGRNRVVYELRGDTVFIVLVVDHRRDFRSALERWLLQPRIG